MLLENAFDRWVCNVEYVSKSDKIGNWEYTNKDYEWKQAQKLKSSSLLESNKIDEKEDTLLDIPKQINDVNRELMLLSMDYFYGKLRVNQEQAKEIEDWINQVRIDLKKNIIRKQNREINNREIYSYLHDIFGHDVIELFDVAHDEMTGNKEGQGE